VSARILGHYRQSGNLKNSAIRAGVSRSALFDWPQRAKHDDREPYRAFSDTLALARAERVAVLTIRHREVALGGVVQLPVVDRFGRHLADREGDSLAGPICE
jgi:hypothetical protein